MHPVCTLSTLSLIELTSSRLTSTLVPRDVIAIWICFPCDVILGTFETESRHLSIIQLSR